MITDINELVDLINSTRPMFEKDGPAMTFNDISHELFNTVFEKAEETTGSMMEWDVTLADQGNGQMVGLFAEDSHNVSPITKKAYAHWAHATTNVSFDLREEAIQSGQEEKLYDMIDNRINNMYREFAEMLQPKLLLPPNSAADDLNPHGIASWLPLGTAGRKNAGFTGYQSTYNDGAGTKYNAGTIPCSAAVNPRWASYFGDHEGRLGDSLIELIDEAILCTGFKPTRIPKSVDKDTDWGNLRFYSNKKVILNLTQLARKMDDNIGPQFGKFLNTYTYMGAPFMYVESLDTADQYLWGTDPLFAVNWDWLKVKCLKGFKFKLQPAYKRDDSHTVVAQPLDVSWVMYSNNRQRLGFLLSQAPSE